MSYRVLLVDDEPLIIESLKVAIPWGDYGMEIAGVARNGMEALERAAELMPDVVVSDIRMPVIDGIAFMRELMAARGDSAPLFVVVSGYGEFEYAREALRYGAFDYVLKPIDHEELERIMEQAKERLDEQNRERRETELLRHSVKTLSMVAKERLYTEMLEGRFQPPQLVDWLDMGELQEPYYTMLIRVDLLQASATGWSPSERKLWLFAVDNIVRDLGHQYQVLSAFSYYSGEWILLLQDRSEFDKLTIAKQTAEAIKRCTKLSCSIGLSGSYIGLNKLSESYQSAVRALYRRFTHSSEEVFLDPDADLLRPSVGQINLASQLKKLIEFINVADRTGIECALKELEQKISDQALSKDQAKLLLIEAAVISHRQFDLHHPLSSDALHGVLESMESALTLKEMVQALELKLIQWLQQAIEARAKEDSLQIIDKAKRYIEANYQKDLGIEDVAEAVQISCSHFCALFKQHTGSTFLEYLTRYRMEKACYMLSHSDVKVFQIAPLVGYQDPRYFTQVFKKIKGITPSEYRDQI